MKKGDKSGQFYLIAAVVIVGLIIGFAAISNYSKKKSSTKVYDLGEELGIEGDQVIQYGVISGEEKIIDFAAEYSDYAEVENRQIIFIFGDRTSVTVITYEEVSIGTISVSGSGTDVTISQAVAETVIPQEGGKVVVTINEIDYEFKLKPGENFYFVISQEIDGEQHVVTGEVVLEDE